MGDGVDTLILRRAARARLYAKITAPSPQATTRNGDFADPLTGTPAQGAVTAVAMATIGADGPTGTFTNDQGPVPW